MPNWPQRKGVEQGAKYSVNEGRTSNKEILELNEIIDQMDLTDVYGTSVPTTAQYIFFSAENGTFSSIDHILRHKVSLNKYKKTEVTPGKLSDHIAIKLKLNNKSSTRKYTNNWRWNNTSVNNQWVKKK
jgi:hypothetical protein